MRTTIDISPELLEEAMKAAHARTKTMAIVLGLQELINRSRMSRLRSLRGKIDMATDLRKSRRR